MPPMTASRRRPPAAVERVFAFGVLLLAVVAACTLTLAEFNAFSRTRLLAAVIPLLAIGTWWILRERVVEAAESVPVARWHSFVLAACVLTLAVVTGRPSEYLVNGDDATVYLNIAAAIEQRGGLVTEDPLLADLDADAQTAFFDRDRGWPHLLNFLPGGIQIAEDASHLQPGFFHLWPAAIAGFSALMQSPSAGDFVTPFAGVLTVVGVWLLAVRLSSPVAATVAVPLLTVNFAHVWFSRFPSSEMVTAALVVAGLLFVVRAAQDASRVAGVLGGMAFGLAASARLDVLVLVTPLVIAYLVIVAARGRWTPATTALAVTATVFTAQAILHAGLIATPYTQRVLRYVFATNWLDRQATLLLPALVVAVALLALFVSRWGRALTRAPVGRVLLAVLLLAMIARSWPQLWSGPGALLLTPVGLVAAVCGAIWLACDDPEPETLLVVALFVVSAVAFLEARTSGRHYPFIWRRFVPIVLPIGLIFVGHVMAVLWRQRSPWRWGAPMTTVGLAVVFALHSQVILLATPMSGMREQISRIARSLPPDSVLVIDSSIPSHFGLSLHFSFNQPVLLIRAIGPAEVPRVADSVVASGRTLMLATSPHPLAGGRLRSDFTGFDFVPFGQTTLRWDELDRSMTDVPTRVEAVEAPIEFYEIRPQQRVTLPLTMDVGEADFRWRGRGFHSVERMDDALVRWTTGAAGVTVPPIEPVEEARLVLRLAAPRPPGRPAPDVSVLLDWRVVGTVQNVSPEFTTIAIDLDRRAIDRLVSGPSALELQSAFFVPRAEGLGDDSRQLGVIVDWLRIETGVAAAPRGRP